MLETRLYQETVAAAEALAALEPWLEFEGEDTFAIAVPGEEHPMFASIMGSRRVEFGLMLTRGPHALPCMLDVGSRDPEDAGLPPELSFLSFSMDRYDATPPIGRRVLAKARYTGKGSSIVPFFIVREPGRQPVSLNPEMAERMLFALKGIAKAMETGILDATGLRRGEEVLTLVASGDPLDPDVASEFRYYTAVREDEDAAPLETPGDLADLPRLPGRWLMGLPTLPIYIEEENRTPRLLLVVEEQTELVLVGEPIFGSAQDAAHLVVDAFRGENTQRRRGIPADVLVANRELCDVLQPALDALGVPCRYQPGIPLLDRIVEGFLECHDEMEDGLEAEGTSPS